MLCTIFRATKADVTAEYEGCEEAPFEVEGIDVPFDEGEGVMTFIFECRVFLNARGVSSASGEGEVQCPSLEGSGA